MTKKKEKKFLIDENDYIIEFFAARNINGPGYTRVIKIVAGVLSFLWNSKKQEWSFTPGMLYVLTDPINYRPITKEQADYLNKQHDEGNKIAFI